MDKTIGWIVTAFLVVTALSFCAAGAALGMQQNTNEGMVLLIEFMDGSTVGYHGIESYSIEGGALRIKQNGSELIYGPGGWFKANWRPDVASRPEAEFPKPPEANQ